MNPETTNPVPQTVSASLNRVTPLSKYLAMLLFIALPFVGFGIGYMYHQESPVALQNIEPENNETPIQPPIQSESEKKVGLELPKNNYLISARTGVFKGYYAKKDLAVSSEFTNVCEVFVITEGDLSMFYEYEENGNPKKLDQSNLPYELMLGDVADARTQLDSLPTLTREVLTKTSPSNQAYVAVTNYENVGGKGELACEGDDFEHIQAISPSWIE